MCVSGRNIVQGAAQRAQSIIIKLQYETLTSSSSWYESGHFLNGTLRVASCGPCRLTYDGSGVDSVLQQLVLQLLTGQSGHVDLLRTNSVCFPGGFLQKRKRHVRQVSRIEY